MNSWDDWERTEVQRRWSGWTMRRPARTLRLNNYMSAMVLMLSAVVVVASQT